MGDMGPPGATLPGERGEKGIPGPVGKRYEYTFGLFMIINMNQ